MSAKEVPMVTAGGIDDVRLVRKAITGWAISVRSTQASKHVDKPRFVSYDRIRLPSGEILGRKKVILMTGGCSVPTCTMCPFTNENDYGHKDHHHDLVTQVRDALVRTGEEPDYELLSLYNDGSFFATNEIPENVQIEIARLVGQAGVRRLVVESLPQFITIDRLRPFVQELGDVALEVGIGFQSSNELIREVLVNTRVSRRQFQSALQVLQDVGAEPKIYLMIKPPFVSEEEALTDVIQSVAYIKERGIHGVTLCPTRVSKNTVAWELYKGGDYAPPNLWTVLEAVKLANRDAEVRVACINLRGSDFESVFPDSCPNCADAIVDGLLDFSETGDTGALDIHCDCRPPLVSVPLDDNVLLGRAVATLKKHQRLSSP